MSLRAAAARAWVAGALALAASCTVPLTMEAGRPAPALDAFPEGTTEVERAAEDGVLLRGVHVPAQPTRALVLHLLPRGASSAGHPFLAGFRETLGTMQAAGYASLAMDYRGIGRSEDPLDAAALPQDAAAMLHAAREAASGAPLVVRACSLGSLAWAAVAGDAAPDALVLVVPVDAATIKGNGFRRQNGAFLGTLLSWFHVDPRVPSLRRTLERATVPTLLLLAEEDPLLPEAEREALLHDLPAHVEAHVLPLTHEELATRLLGFEMGAAGGRMVPELLPYERDFLERVLPDAAAAAQAADDWYEVVAALPGPEVTDATMRARLEASGHPWKVRDRATGIEMVLVLPGEFEMGSPASERGHAADEGPQHRVRLTRAYYLGATEVTQAQWQRLMGPTSTFFPGPQRPIDPSFRDVEAFLSKANAGSPAGRAPLRLPTEAEWEYACRAGTAGPWHFDPPIGHGQVNFNDGVVEEAVVIDGRLEVTWRTPPSAECRMQTAAAGSLAPNPWGLHGMHGSLWEWCADRYDPEAYAGRGELAVDPFEPAAADDLRVLRGGSWYDRLELCRSAVRDAGGPQVRSNRIGVRVARSL